MNDLLLLAALADGPKHGYRLKKEAGFIAGTKEMHNNIVYPLLQRFTTEKLIQSKVVPGKRGQTKREYSLTAKGRTYLIELLSNAGQRNAQSAEDFLLRVGLFGILDRADRLKILEERERSTAERTKRLEGIEREMPLDRYAKEVMGYLAAKTKLEREFVRRLAAREKN